MPTPPQSARAPVSDWPMYWFAALERAIDAGDFAAAAKAQAELERLGVTVTYRPRQAKPEVQHAR